MFAFLGRLLEAAEERLLPLRVSRRFVATYPVANEFRGSKVGIAAIFKNEAPYLREWLDFHRAAGVDRFYLYDNGSTDESAAIAASVPDTSVIPGRPLPGKTTSSGWRTHTRHETVATTSVGSYSSTLTSLYFRRPPLTFQKPS